MQPHCPKRARSRGSSEKKKQKIDGQIPLLESHILERLMGRKIFERSDGRSPQQQLACCRTVGCMHPFETTVWARFCSWQNQAGVWQSLEPDTTLLIRLGITSSPGVCVCTGRTELFRRRDTCMFRALTRPGTQPTRTG